MAIYIVSFFLVLAIFFILYLLSKISNANCDCNGHENTINNNIQSLEKNLSTSMAQIDILEERENYRREYLGNVAHELKTPLFSIQGFLLTLLVGGIDDEDIRDKYLDRINKSVDRLIYIVKDLDLITELEAGNLRLNIKPFNIVSLSQEVFDLLEIKALKHNIILRFDQSYEFGIFANGDIERIQQVIVNLVVNAIKHSQDSKQVVVGFKLVNSKVQVSVTDFGIGIAEDKLPRIFERFYRVEKSRNRKQGGSGLGLSIVKHIIEAHGGTIKVNSTLGEETSFIFEIDKALDS